MLRSSTNFCKASVGRFRGVEAEDGSSGSTVVGMVEAVPLGEVGIFCHLAVHHDHRKLDLGTALSSWSISYLRSRDAKAVWLDSTHGAKRLYESLGFKPVSRRTVYRLEGASWRFGCGMLTLWTRGCAACG